MEYSSAPSAVSVDTVTSLPQVLGSVDKIEATQIAKQKELLTKAQANAGLLQAHELTKVLFVI
jgi:hypothetical protein